ncbi:MULTISPECIES: hypothetical protein [Ferrimicrobium]|uniref:Uncharacterized protein n=1 Tax=Ferrimicrobium acidiphilum TaxID=121039 RepID=A0ABV3XYE7_9ACTN|nr:hypothetical protein [Ferrimicrobium sp.]
MLEIRGPGHHERSELAAVVTRVLASVGREVWVRMDIRPRLAADISTVLDEGASKVLLVGQGLYGVASSDELVHEVPSEVTMIELRALADPLGLYGAQTVLTDQEIAALRREGVVVDGVS